MHILGEGGKDDMVYKHNILYCRAVEAGGWRGCSWAAPGCRSGIGIHLVKNVYLIRCKKN